MKSIRLCVLGVAMTATWLLGAALPAHGGTKTQGTKTQGTKTQGTKTQGTKTQGTKTQGTKAQGTEVPGMSTPAIAQGAEAPPVRQWAQGPQFHGILVDPQGSHLRTVTVIGFRGARVDAFVWSADAGFGRRELAARELVGLTWLEYQCTASSVCTRMEYRITDVEIDSSQTTMPAHRDNGDVALFTVEFAVAEDGPATGWQNVCTPDDSGMAKALFMDGRWRLDGSYDPEGYTLACTSGVIAKCARGFGYKPWAEVHTEGGARVPMQPLHQACVRAARADYCGDGVSYTVDGTQVDLADTYGLNHKETDTGFVSEAVFGPDGALSVARTRWPMGARSGDMVVRLPGCSRPKEVPAPSPSDARIQVFSAARLERAGE